MELKNKSLFKQECFIGGKWVKSLNNDTIQVDNPATLKSIGNVPKSVSYTHLTLPTKA